MPTVSMMKNPVRTLLGPMLSMALLSVFASCVFGCEELTKERAGKEVTVSFAELQPAKACDDCPFNSFPKAMRSQRLTVQTDAQVQDVIPSSMSLSFMVAGTSLFAPSVSPPTKAPPLKRLPSLRI